MFHEDASVGTIEMVTLWFNVNPLAMKTSKSNFLCFSVYEQNKHFFPTLKYTIITPTQIIVNITRKLITLNLYDENLNRTNFEIIYKQNA